MTVTDRQHLPLHLNKWIVTIGEGKALSKGDQRDFFFRKLNPFCELSLGDQGPYPTSIKSNTAQPVWNDSIEFEAAISLSPHRLQEPLLTSKGADGGNDEGSAGPKINIVCFTRSSIKAPEDPEGSRGGTGCSKLEIGRGEVKLGSSKTGKVVAPLWRLSAENCQIPTGNITVEYIFVEGIPRRYKALPPEELANQEREMGAPDSPGDTSGSRNPRRFGFIRRICSGGDLRNSSRGRLERILEGPYHKPAILVAFSAMIVALLTAQFSSLQLSPNPSLAPIAVPFKISAGKWKGSVTHHVRLHADDGNVVIARGREPSADSGVPATNIGVLWESGPIRSLGRSRYPFVTACRRCKLHVYKDGSMMVVRGREKLAVFTPSTVKYVDAIFKVE